MSRPILSRILLIDAAACVLLGAALVAGAGFAAPHLGLPQALIFYAGLILFPCATLMALAGTRKPIVPALVWLVIAGNAAWVAASLAVILLFAPTALGIAVILAQALAGAILGALEYRHLVAAAPAPARA